MKNNFSFKPPTITAAATKSKLITKNIFAIFNLAELFVASTQLQRLFSNPVVTPKNNPAAKTKGF